MIDYEQALLKLITPMVDNKDDLVVKTLPNDDDNHVILLVYANSNDVARLIGRKGMMASALRQVVSIGSYEAHKKITIKFESLEA